MTQRVGVRDMQRQDRGGQKSARRKVRSAVGRIFLFLILAFPLCLWSAQAEQVTGKVVSVLDGDTLVVLDESKRQHKIRLHQIDAPEKRQDYGTRSRQSLADLAFGKPVSVKIVARDRYGRKVGQVLVDGLDVGLEQIRRGMAWVYRQYATDPVYFAAEASARQKRLGLWVQPHPIPPWQWRHVRRDNAFSIKTLR